MKNLILLFIFLLISIISNILFNISSVNVSSYCKNTQPIVCNDTVIDKKFLLGKFKASTDSSFALVELKHTNKNNMYLRKSCYNSFINMYNAALKDGVKLIIVSSTRSFNEQKYIWERKWNGGVLVNGKNLAAANLSDEERALEILHFSSMPGTSRHHWGTDIDLNSLESRYFNTVEGIKVYTWLSINANKYGFYQPYTTKSSPSQLGYEEEKWHWSYYPIADLFQKQYKQTVSYLDLQGFLGCKTAEKINVIDNFVLNIRGKH